MTGTILLPLIGGILIGLASSVMLGGIGRITGISGIISSSLSRPSKENYWRYSFIIGLLFGGWIMYITMPEFFAHSLDGHIYKIIAAGLLVGYGTQVGSGCTSGHGVCGMARLAKRSFVATFTFMAFGILTVAIEAVLK